MSEIKKINALTAKGLIKKAVRAGLVPQVREKLLADGWVERESNNFTLDLVEDETTGAVVKAAIKLTISTKGDFTEKKATKKKVDSDPVEIPSLFD